MSMNFPKTIILAIATLMLAVAALVTDLVSPYAGGIDRATSPVEVQMPNPSPYRVPVRAMASNPTVSTLSADTI